MTFRSLPAFFVACICLLTLAACGGGDDGISIPAGAKECNMKLYGVAIWGEVRPPSAIEAKTYAFGQSTDYSVIGGHFDGSHAIFRPRLIVQDMGSGWLLVEVAAPPFAAGPPLLSGKMRIRSDAYEGYRYGRIWSCMVEELDFKDRVFIRAAGDETVPARVAVEAYWPRMSWNNLMTLPAQAEYFSIEGDATLLSLQ